MKKQYKITTLAIAISTLTACGGGGGSTSSTAPSNTTALAGIVADGYLNGATVCLDQDLDNSCVGEAVSTTSTAGGEYSLVIPEGVDGNSFPIVVEVSKGTKDEGESSDASDDIEVAADFTLSTPPGKGGFISPLTTMIHKIARDNTPEELKRVEEEIIEQLGLEDSNPDLFANFVTKSAQGNEATQYKTLFRVAQLLARNLANTQAELTKNTSANKADMATVANLKAADQLATLSGVVSANSESFNPDKLAEQQKSIWTDAVKNIKSASDISDFKNSAKLPKVRDAGVYQFTDKTVSPNISTPKARIMFYAKKDVFKDWNIQLKDSTGAIKHTFVDADIDNALLTRTKILSFSKQISSLNAGNFTFIATPKTGTAKEITLARTEFGASTIKTDPVSNAEIGTEVYARVHNKDKSLILSVPYGESSTYFGGFLTDANDKVLDFNGWRKGKNLFYFKAEHKDAAKNIFVLGRDGETFGSSNAVVKRIDSPIKLSESTAEFNWMRSNNFTGYVDVPNDKYTEANFNIDLEGAKDEQNLALDEIKLESFNGNTYDLKTTCSETRSGSHQYSCTQGVNIDTEAFAENGDDYSTHFFGITDDQSSRQLKKGNYRLTFTDRSGKTDVAFTHLGESDPNGGGLNISQLTLDSNADIADGWVDANIATNPNNANSGVTLYHQVDFRIQYNRKSDNKSKTVYVIKTPTSSYAKTFISTAVLKKKVEDRIKTLSAKGEKAAKLVVRLNAHDARRSENQNNAWYTSYKDTGYFAELFK